MTKNYDTPEFFNKDINHPDLHKIFSDKSGYIYINIVFTELNVYRNLLSKFDFIVKIDENFVPKSKYNLYKEKLCKYVFLRLFRLLFFYDFIHDFAQPSRTGNELFKNKQEKDQTKKKIIDTYYSIYQEDLKDIINFVFSGTPLENKPNDLFDNIEISINDRSSVKLSDFDNKKNLYTYTEEVIKQKVVKIINFFGIFSIDTIDINKNCGNTFDEIITKINGKKIYKNVNILVDADRSRYSLYPIILKMCDILTQNLDSIDSITLNNSILDKYDSASSSKLKKIIQQFKNIYKNNPNIGKIQDVDLPYNKIKIIFKLDRDDEYDKRFIEIDCSRGRDNVPKLQIDRFFSTASGDNQTITDSSVSYTSIGLKNILNLKDDKIKFINNLYNYKNYFIKKNGIFEFNLNKLEKNHPFVYKNLISQYKTIYNKDIVNEDKIGNEPIKVKEKLKEFLNGEFINDVEPKLDTQNNIIFQKYNTSEEYNDLWTNKPFVLKSLYKTMGDFTKIILCHQLSKINLGDIYLFISFDKIASYISSIFNYGTLKEEDQNPILPLKYFANNWNLPSIYNIYSPNVDDIHSPFRPSRPSITPSITPSSINSRDTTPLNLIFDPRTYFTPIPVTPPATPVQEVPMEVENDRLRKRTQTPEERPETRQRTEFGKSKNKVSKVINITKNDLINYSRRFGFPKSILINLNKNQIIAKIKSLIALSNKYNIKLNKDTYKNLLQLHKLQLISKKYKITITKSNKSNKSNKRVYKTAKELTNEIKRKLNFIKNK